MSLKLTLEIVLFSLDGIFAGYDHIGDNYWQGYFNRYHYPKKSAYFPFTGLVIFVNFHLIYFHYRGMKNGYCL